MSNKTKNSSRVHNEQGKHECCDESKQNLRDWIECGFKFCPWCGRELRPVKASSYIPVKCKFGDDT